MKPKIDINILGRSIVYINESGWHISILMNAYILDSIHILNGLCNINGIKYNIWCIFK
jgi:hypothetical protein